jgi:dTDP-4-dehydrorhamnose reductase
MIHKTDRIIAAGCAGMLGEAVYEAFKDICEFHPSDIALNVPWLERLDVRSEKEVSAYLKKLKPNFIINLAALTDMEYCELYPEDAYSTNTGGVQHLVNYAREHNIPFVYISTAGIFDGEKDEYAETDSPNPLSVYGKSKYGGELVAKTLPKHIIIRAGWMMGGGPNKDKKFVNKIIKQLRAGAKELAVVNDKYGTPCHTYDLAQSIKYLLDHDAYGLYHGACDGGGNRVDVARYLLECLGVANQVKIREVDSSFFLEHYFAPRPKSEKLINNDLKKIAPHLTRDWKICLKEYIERFNWNLWDLNTSGMERHFYKNYFKIEKEHWLMIGRRAIVCDNLSKYLSKKADDIRILEFGCGSGLFVDELSKKGYKSSGLDISSEAVIFGELRGINNLGVIDSHKIHFPDNSFDVVITLDVLEHLEDEAWALKEMERVLKPGGIMTIMAPAYMFLWGVQDVVSHHYRRYTRGNLVSKIKHSTTLKLIRSSYFNTFLFPPIAIFRLISKLFQIKGRESDFDINNRFLDKTFASIFNFERKLLKTISYPFGVSILLILKKEKEK